MKPILIHLRNVRSHLDTTLDLGGIRLAVIQGKNGDGKSTVVNAIRNALTGWVPDSLPAWVNDHAQEGGVEFLFEHGGAEHTIRRAYNRKGRGKSILSLTSGDVVLGGNDIRETDERIAELIGMSAGLLESTIFCSQGDADRFPRAKPGDRRATLAEILGHGLYQRRAQTARRKAAEEEGALGAAEREITRLRADSDTQEGILAEHGVIAADLVSLEGTIAAAQDQLAEAETTLAGLVAAAARAKELRGQADSLAAQIGSKREARHAGANRAQGMTHSAAERTALEQQAKTADEAKGRLAGHEERHQKDEDNLHESDKQLAAIDSALEKHDAEEKMLDDRIAGAKREHKQACQAVADRIASAIQAQNAKVEAAQTHLDRMEKQTELIGKVPCTVEETWYDRSGDPFKLTEGCPLLTLALEAQAALPNLRIVLADSKALNPAAEDEKTLRALEEETPWADDELRLKILRGILPTKDQEDRLQELEEERRAIGYDLQAHEADKRAATSGDEARTKIAKLDADASALAEVNKQIAELDEELNALGIGKSKADAELELLGGPEAYRTCAEGAVCRAKGSITDLQGQLTAGRSRVAVLEEQLKQAQAAGKKADELEAGLAAGRDRLQLLRVLTDDCSPRGIPALLMELAVPQLEAAANRALSIMWDGEMGLAIATQRENKDGTLAEAMDLTVTIRGEQRTYEDCSGGEQRAVDLAARLALAELMATRAGNRCRFRVFDEAGDNMDAHHRRLLLKYLVATQGDYDCTIWISHNTDEIDAFPTRILVSRDESGGSRLEVLS